MGFDNRYFHWYFWHFFCVPKHVERFQRMPLIQRINGNTRKMSVARKDDGSLHLIPILFPITNKNKKKNNSRRERKKKWKRKRIRIDDVRI